ncbi:MAG: CopL family metal-binding regulatory protein [Pseudomonadota bacterium]
MTPFSLLLRVLLCVSLIANGIGFAGASTRMQLVHANHGAMSLSTQAAAAGCIHPATARALAADRSPADGAAVHAGHTGTDDAAGYAADLGSVTPDAPAGDMDCCDGSDCQCACAQHASVGFIADIPPGAISLRSPVVMRGASQHVSPRLSHLIRPPIG